MCVKSKQESFAAWKDSSDQICKTVKLLFPMHKVSVLQNNLLLLAFVAPIAPVTIASSLPGCFPFASIASFSVNCKSLRYEFFMFAFPSFTGMWQNV